MSVDLQCFFSECMLVMCGSRGGPTLTTFFIFLFFFQFEGRKDSNTIISGPLKARQRNAI